mmetsp:Transcript_74524/g.141106  ORF Transcript_74524/g.141106 Transcript_74524/m.141106 type:complete len:200 (+) Transcript_74524:3-602(+)
MPVLRTAERVNCSHSTSPWFLVQYRALKRGSGESVRALKKRLQRKPRPRPASISLKAAKVITAYSSFINNSLDMRGMMKVEHLTPNTATAPYATPRLSMATPSVPANKRCASLRVLMHVKNVARVPTNAVGSRRRLSKNTLSIGPMEFVRMVANPPTNPITDANHTEVAYAGSPSSAAPAASPSFFVLEAALGDEDRAL